MRQSHRRGSVQSAVCCSSNQHVPLHGSPEHHSGSGITTITHDHVGATAASHQQPVQHTILLPPADLSLQQQQQQRAVDEEAAARLRSQLQGCCLPDHIAVIMDGNARWARQRGRPITAGHEAGAQRLEQLVRMCRMLDIPALTVYAFSAENWNRPAAEVDFLLRLFERTIDHKLQVLQAEGVRVVFIGDRQSLPASLLAKMDNAEQKTCDNTQLLLSVAVSYSAREDLSRAARGIASLAAQGLLDPAQVDSSMLESHLSTSHAPPVDLLIRTSGEQRLSNFLLYELAYCELYFVDSLWPDFGEEQLVQALRAYSSRQRRYGARSP